MYPHIIWNYIIYITWLHNVIQTRSENVHEMSSELREIFDQVGRTRAAKIAKDHVGSTNKNKPTTTSSSAARSQEEPIYGNINTAMTPYTGEQEVDRSYYYPPGTDGSMDPYAYYPTEYTYDQMIQYAQAIGQQYLAYGDPTVANQRTDIDVLASRPGVLEVQYSGGPITIAVDTNAASGSSQSTRPDLPPSGAITSSSRNTEPSHHRSADYIAAEPSVDQVGNRSNNLNHSFAARGAADRTFELDGQLGHLVQGQFHPYSASESESSPQHRRAGDITSQMRHEQQSPVLNFPMAADKNEPPDSPNKRNPTSVQSRNQDLATTRRPVISDEDREGSEPTTVATENKHKPIASIRKSISNRNITGDLSMDYTDKSIGSSDISSSIDSVINDRINVKDEIVISDEESEISQTSYQINISNDELSSDDTSSELSMSSDSMDYDRYDEEDAQSYLSDLEDIPSDFASELSSRSNELAEKRIAELHAERQKEIKEREEERKERDRIELKQREDEKIERGQLLKNERELAAQRESQIDREYRERIDDLTADFRAEIQRQRDEINRQRSLLDEAKSLALRENEISRTTQVIADRTSSDGSSLASPDFSPNGTPNGTPKEFLTRQHVFAPRVTARKQEDTESERPPDIDVDTQLNEIVAKLKQEEVDDEEKPVVENLSKNDSRTINKDLHHEENTEDDSEDELSTDTLTDSETISIDDESNLANEIKSADDSNTEITQSHHQSIPTNLLEPVVEKEHNVNVLQVGLIEHDKSGNLTESEMSDYLSVSEFRDDHLSTTEGEDNMTTCTEGEQDIDTCTEDEDHLTYNEESGNLAGSELNTCTDSELNTSTDTRASERGSSPTFSEGGSRYLTSRLLSNSDTSSVSLISSVSPGIGLRVTGTTPKAYRRSANEAARRAFMLATPVGIESSDDSTIGDLAGSRSSLSSLGGGGGHQKPPAPATKPNIALGLVKVKKDESTNEDESKKQSISEAKRQFEAKAVGIIGASLIAKPYQSLGTIKNDTTEIDEVLATRSRDSSFGSLDDPNEKQKNQQLNIRSSFQQINPISDDEPPVNVIKTDEVNDNGNEIESLVSVESNVKVSDLKKKLKLGNSNINEIMKDNIKSSTISNRPIDLPLKAKIMQAQRAKQMKLPIVLNSISSKTNQNILPKDSSPVEEVNMLTSISNINDNNDQTIKEEISKEEDQETNQDLLTPMDPSLNTLNLKNNHSAPKAQRKAAKLAAKLERKNKRKEKREHKEEKLSHKLKYKDTNEIQTEIHIENSIATIKVDNEDIVEIKPATNINEYIDDIENIDDSIPCHSLPEVDNIPKNNSEERIYYPEKLAIIAADTLNKAEHEIIPENVSIPVATIANIDHNLPVEIQENSAYVQPDMTDDEDDNMSENNNITSKEESEKEIKRREKNARKNARKEKRDKKELRRLKKASKSKENIQTKQNDDVENEYLENIEKVDIDIIINEEKENVIVSDSEENEMNIINKDHIQENEEKENVQEIIDRSDSKENEMDIENVNIEYLPLNKEIIEKDIEINNSAIAFIQDSDIEKETKKQDEYIIDNLSAQSISEIPNKMDKFPSPKEIKSLKKKAKEERKQHRSEKREKKQARKIMKKEKLGIKESDAKTDSDVNIVEREVVEIATFDAFAIEVLPKNECPSKPEEPEKIPIIEENETCEIVEKESSAITELITKCEEVEQVKQSYHARVRDQMQIVSAELSDIEVDNVALLKDLSEKNYSLENEIPIRSKIHDEDETNIIINRDKYQEIIPKLEDSPPEFEAPPIPVRNPRKPLSIPNSDSLDKLIPVVDAYSPRTSRLDESFTDESFSLKSFSEIEEHHYFDMNQQPVAEENIYQNEDERKINQPEEDIYMNTNEVEYMNSASVARKNVGDVECAYSDQVVARNKEEHEYMNSQDLKRVPRNVSKQGLVDSQIYENASNIKPRNPENEYKNSNQIQRDIEYVNTKKVRSNPRGENSNKSPAQLNKVQGIPRLERDLSNNRKSKGASGKTSSKTNRPNHGPPLPPVPKRDPSTSLTAQRHVEGDKINGSNKNAIEYSNEPLRRRSSTLVPTTKDNALKQSKSKEDVEYSNTPLQRKISNNSDKMVNYDRKQIRGNDNIEYSNTHMRRSSSNASNDANEDGKLKKEVEYSNTPLRRNASNSSNEPSRSEDYKHNLKHDVEYSNAPIRRKISQTSIKDETTSAKKSKDNIEYSNAPMRRANQNSANVCRSSSVGNNGDKEDNLDDGIIEYMNAPLRRSMECEDLRIDQATVVQPVHMSAFEETDIENIDKSVAAKIPEQQRKPAKKITPVALKPKKRLSRGRPSDEPSDLRSHSNSRDDSSETLITSTIPRILSLEDLVAQANNPGSTSKGDIYGISGDGPVEQSSFEEMPPTPIHMDGVEEDVPPLVNPKVISSSEENTQQGKSSNWRKMPSKNLPRTSDRHYYDDSSDATEQQLQPSNSKNGKTQSKRQSLSFRPAVPVELKSGSLPVEMGEVDRGETSPATNGRSQPQAPPQYTLQDQPITTPAINVQPPDNNTESTGNQDEPGVVADANYYPAEAAYDPTTGAYYDPTTGAYYPEVGDTTYDPSGAQYDASYYPASEQSYDPTTGTYYDPSTYAYDPTTGAYFDPNSSAYYYAQDPAAVYTNPSSVYPDPGQDYYDPEGRVYDPFTGLYYEQETGEYFDPAVGFHYDFEACQYYDRDSGLYYDPLSGAFFDADGTVHSYQPSFYYYEGANAGTTWNEQTGEYEVVPTVEEPEEETYHDPKKDREQSISTQAKVQDKKPFDPNNPNGRVVMRRRSGRRIRIEPPSKGNQEHG